MNQGLQLGFNKKLISAARMFPLHDTWLNSVVPTEINDAHVELLVGGGVLGTSSFQRYSLLTFDVGSLSGKTISMAKLRMVVVESSGGIASNTMFCVKEMLRPYVSDQTSWNEWASGSAWGGAGGSQLDVDISTYTYGAASVLLNTAPCDFYINLQTLVQKAVDAGQSLLRVMVFALNGTTDQHAIKFHSKESATEAYRPTLTVLYS